MDSGQLEQVAATYTFLFRLLFSSSSPLQVGMVLDQFDADEQLHTQAVTTGAKK